MKKPVVLVIMDGFGINPNHKNNAVYSAKTPNLDKFVEMYSLTRKSALRAWMSVFPTDRWATARSVTPT